MLGPLNILRSNDPGNKEETRIIGSLRTQDKKDFDAVFENIKEGNNCKALQHFLGLEKVNPKTAVEWKKGK